MQFFGLRGHLGDASALATARYPETLDSILVNIDLLSYTLAITDHPVYRSLVLHLMSKQSGVSSVNGLTRTHEQRSQS